MKVTVKKWQKKTLLATGIIAVVALVLAGVVAAMAKAKPSFYRPASMASADFEESAKRMEDKLIELRNLAAEMQASTVASGAMTTRYVLTITQDELNAFLLKWAELNAVRGSYERYARHPMIGFEPGRVIFAAETTMGPIDCISSVHAALEQKGDTLNLSLEKVQAGRLTVPRAAWQGQVDRATGAVRNQLRGWRDEARFDRYGAANDALAKVMAARMLLAALEGVPADARAIIPVSASRGVAVRLAAVTVGE